MTKKKRQSIIALPKVVAVVTLTLVAILTVDFGRKALDNYRNQRQVEWLRQQVDQEVATNEELSDRLAYVSGDAYVERTAREQLKLTQPGDTSVVVVLEEPQSPTEAQQDPASVSSEEESAPYWQQWAALLLGSDE